jgi:beta-lactamase class A
MRSTLLVTLLVGCAADPAVVGGGGDPPVHERPEEVPVAAPVPLPTATVAQVIAWLDAEVATRSPGTEFSITWEDLTTGDHASLRGDVKHISASSAKAWWVAAALDTVGIAPVTPYASPIFVNSDNGATGSVIDLIGPDAVNPWMWNVAGMNDSAFTQWNYNGTRVASNSPRAMGSNNYATTDDSVTILTRLYKGDILAGATGDQLLTWMTLSPNTGTGGWLPARLPMSVQDTAMHKGGWLPPGCCSFDYNTSNEIGIIVTPSGGAYAIAIFARYGNDYWNKQVQFVELSSCLLYRAFMQDETIDCE